MLDLMQNKTEGVGTHGVVKIARVGQEEVYGAKWSVDFTPATEEDAVLIDEFVPGAARMWMQAEAARESAKEASATEGAAAASTALAGVEGRAQVSFRNVDVMVTVANDKGVVVSGGEITAKVTIAQFRATGRQVYLRVMLEAEALTLSQVANLMRCSELANATVAVERKQYELDLPAEAGDTVSDAADKPKTVRRPRVAPRSGSARA